MKRDAETHAEEDKARREIVELKNRAEMMVHATNKSLEEHGDKVSQEVRSAIEAAVSKNRKWQKQLENIENKIARIIGVKVTIKKSKKTGKGFVKIHFDSKTWERVLEALGIK